MRRLSVLPALLLLLLPTILAAQSIPSPFRFIETSHSIGLYGGYLLPDAGSLDLGPKAAPIFGARYNLHFTGPLSGEVVVGISPGERSIYAPATGGAQGQLQHLGDTELMMMMAEGGLRFHFTGARAWNGLAPYGIVTGGIAIDASGLDELEEEIPAEQRFQFGPAFAAGIGLGTDFFLTERFSLRAEVRDHIWRLTHPGGLTESGQRETQWRNNIGLTLGGAIHF